MASLSLSHTPQKYQQPIVGEEHCGVRLRDTAEELRRSRQHFPLPMLIRSKGSPAFVRLVAPNHHSVGQSSAYLLVTEKRIIVYSGGNASISARSKVSQMAYEIIAGKELPSDAHRVEIANDDPKIEYSFWGILGGGTANKDEAENEEEESCAEDAIYEVNGDGRVDLIARGQRPDCKMLHPEKVLIFHFISEIYVWSGTQAKRALLPNAVNFARELRLQSIGERAARIVCHPDGNSPAEWTLFRRLHESIVDTLFKHKFERWRKPPPLFGITQRTTSVTNKPIKEIQGNGPIGDRSQSAREIVRRLASNGPPRDAELILEEVVLRPEEGGVFTEGLSVYSVVGDELRELEGAAANEFDRDKCYVIGWEYRVERTGIRKLDGSEAQHRECGRTRKCFFYWLGKDTSVAERSRCALALREWDSERREHIRVEAGAEPPILLHVLGGMIVRGTGSGTFCVTGSTGLRCVAEEMEPKAWFRSQGAYLRVSQGRVERLQAEDCPSAVAECAKHLALKLASLRGLAVCGDRTAGLAAEKVLRPLCWIGAPRLFRHYENQVWEVPHPHPSANFAFGQSDLRDCMLVDQGKHFWLWCADDRIVPAFALRVSFLYWFGEEYSPGKLVPDGPCTAHVIHAGAEPDEFKALFAEWTDTEKSVDAKGPESLFDVIRERLKMRTVDELRRRELPPGCDTKHLEDYLSDADFERVFRISRREFGELPRWRQLGLKKAVDLF